MQVNAVQAQLNSLHKTYNNCLMNSVDAWMNNSAAQRSDQFEGGAVEFCVEEKNAYMNYMERNAPVQFKNIMRLEQGNL